MKYEYWKPKDQLAAYFWVVNQEKRTYFVRGVKILDEDSNSPHIHICASDHFTDADKIAIKMSSLEAVLKGVPRAEVSL